MKVNKEILDILEEGRIEDNLYFLPQKQLDRKTYTSVNKCLESLGGKWSRKLKAHVFDSCPQDEFDNFLATGEITDFKKEFQFFETPKSVVAKMIELSELESHHYVLEPSAGRGAIADEIFKVTQNLDLIELSEENCKALNSKNYHVKCGDFLEVPVGQKYDRIIMNPPFSRQNDISHVLNAWDHLKDGGILVAITSRSWTFRHSNKAEKFRDFVGEHMTEVFDLPEGTFKESGTMIRTKLLVLKK